MRTNLTQLRKANARERLSRVRRLRAMGAPAWVVKDEQVRLACNRRGLRGSGNKLAEALRLKHVVPLVNKELS